MPTCGMWAHVAIDAQHDVRDADVMGRDVDTVDLDGCGGERSHAHSPPPRRSAAGRSALGYGFRF